jgi:hypothetical protein
MERQSFSVTLSHGDLIVSAARFETDEGTIKRAQDQSDAPDSREACSTTESVTSKLEQLDEKREDNRTIKRAQSPPRHDP